MQKLQVASLGLTAVAALALSACGSDDAAAPATSSTTTTSAAAPMAANATGVTTASDVFGPACAKLPQGNEPGSLASMGPMPVASAASTNPVLTKLVAAVKATKLVDTLNSQPAITVFAPADAAFDALGEAKFQQLAKNPDQLAPILQYHVVGKRYDATGLTTAGTVDTLAGGQVTITGSGDTMAVNGAKVLCGNIPTANATVFVIDKVLTPSS